MVWILYQIILATLIQLQSMQIIHGYAEHYASGNLAGAEQRRRRSSPQPKIMWGRRPPSTTVKAPAQPEPAATAQPPSQPAGPASDPGVGVPRLYPGGTKRARDSAGSVTYI